MSGFPPGFKLKRTGNWWARWALEFGAAVAWCKSVDEARTLAQAVQRNRRRGLVPLLGLDKLFRDGCCPITYEHPIHWLRNLGGDE